MMRWSWKAFEALTADELYALLKLRAEVFVVEQQCVYLDMDDLDQQAMHCQVHDGGDLIAYLRAIPKAYHHSSRASLGRIIVAPRARKSGLGKQLVQTGIDMIHGRWQCDEIFIAAQHHLHGFYSQLGFKAISSPYDEDGIQHIDMLKSSA